MSLFILLIPSCLLFVLMAIVLVQSARSPRVNRGYYAGLAAAIAGLIVAALESMQALFTFLRDDPKFYELWGTTRELVGTAILIGIAIAFVGGFFNTGWRRIALIAASFAFFGLHVLTVLGNGVW